MPQYLVTCVETCRRFTYHIVTAPTTEDALDLCSTRNESCLEPEAAPPSELETISSDPTDAELFTPPPPPATPPQIPRAHP